jgi:hypothetical protein
MQGGLLLITCTVSVKISHRLSIDVPNHFILFTRASPRIKSKGLSIDAPYNFYYFQHVQRRIHISKGLSIDAPYSFYYFQHMQRLVQKVRGSLGMCSRFII